METVADYFGSMVFNDECMRERLSKDVYKALKKTIAEGKDIDLTVANAVANAMKLWAVEKGCTHYTHWFQPLTGMTAEKHDAFITPIEGGKVLLEFSGKELVKGEPDASSFPSGCLRATFEARVYTAWDPTSYAFIKGDTLCIPTAYCSYSGEVLDKKTPLLRSMEVISTEAVKVLKLFGLDDVKRVVTTVGPEQEYFLVDKKHYEKREDLILTGRTLFGAKSPKGQEKDDHYFGALRTRVAEYMADLDKELWLLGINAKTSHNEVAPCQHELAPVYTVSNVAVDHNQITMELMKKIAERHGFACLLHEKPFEGVNGSGKHNNWSISTDTGINLLEPGHNPKDNTIFLLFMMAVIKAVDEYQDLLRICAASAGNDHRLGANEAPPAIVSMFIGSDLEEIFNALGEGRDADVQQRQKMSLGVHVLPVFSKDSSDRNRTSPMAFTGNKFEFRMLGSSFSVSGPNIALNTAVAKALKEFYVRLNGAKDINEAAKNLIAMEWNLHKRIVFNGNAYAPEWREEAENRGLMNLQSSPDAFDQYIAEKNIQLFSEFGIYTPVETHSRCEIHHEEYSKTVHIEAQTMIDMINKAILPACSLYAGDLAKGIKNIKTVCSFVEPTAEESILQQVVSLSNELYGATRVLAGCVKEAESLSGSLQSHYYCTEVLPKMDAARAYADALEQIVGKEYWPFPTYSDILFYV
ncbi:MAG: glutamine synthetase III [Spirochaetales bacterium]|nr:glutamine synthetase III [Candidatus Physcosoma equi]